MFRSTLVDTHDAPPPAFAPAPHEALGTKSWPRIASGQRDFLVDSAVERCAIYVY